MAEMVVYAWGVVAHAKLWSKCGNGSGQLWLLEKGVTSDMAEGQP